MKSKISRRSFIKNTALSTIPLTLGGFPLMASARSSSAFLNEGNDNILVLIQLQGGNDGLATIYDDNQYANLNAVRNNILVPQSSILNFHNDYGFHPSMQGMKDVWDMGSLGVVQNVGYPNQNRSHFRSNDIWNSASAAEDFVNTGWIGRYYDLNHAGYPNGYPNVDCPHPFALTMGKIVSETCQGVDANYSLSLLDPFNPGTAIIGAQGAIPANCYGDALSFVNDTVAQTNAYAQVITDAANAGNNLSSKWDNLATELSAKLKNVARLIAGGLQTKIYVVQLGGFDTHDNQVDSTNVEQGIHSNLLSTLSDAICAFQDDLNLLAIDDKVIGMTYSEFGRRIKSNAGLGTDHGTAAPLFLFGSCVKNEILGDHPVIDPQTGEEEGVAMQYDFRNIYGTILEQWLGLSEIDVQNIIFSNYQSLPIIEPSCIAAILPLELLKFTGTKAGRSNQLRWMTTAEVNVDYFLVERSNNGQNDWKTVGKVSAKGNSVDKTAYQLLDENPIDSAYYRLKIVDFGGTVDYSQVIYLERQSNNEQLLIYPNPSSGLLNIEYQTAGDSVDITISDIRGGLIQTIKTDGSVNKKQITKIDISNWPTGTYFIRLSSKQDRVVRKFVKI